MPLPHSSLYSGFFFSMRPVLRIRIWDPVPFWPLDPGSGMNFFPDPGSQTHIFESLVTTFWVKSSELVQIFFLQHLKNKIIFNFVKFVATNKVWHQIFFTLSLFCCCFWIWDPGSGMGKNQDPGSGINIQDPQHWMRPFLTVFGEVV